MKLYYSKSGQIYGFSRDHVNLPGESIAIVDKELPAELLKSRLMANFKIVEKKLKKAKIPKDSTKQLTELTAGVDKVLHVKLRNIETG
jgi:hypothetical protein